VLYDLEHELDHKGQLPQGLGLRSALGMPILRVRMSRPSASSSLATSFRKTTLRRGLRRDRRRHSPCDRNEAGPRAASRNDGRLLTLQDDERRRLAGELHDTTGQNLSMLVLNMTFCLVNSSHRRNARKIMECGDLARTSLQEVKRSRMSSTRPCSTNWVSSGSAYIHRGLCGRSGILVDLELPDRSIRVPRDLETTSFEWFRRVFPTCTNTRTAPRLAYA